MFFNFQDANIDRSRTSSMFNVGTTLADIYQKLDAKVLAESANITFGPGPGTYTRLSGDGSSA